MDNSIQESIRRIKKMIPIVQSIPYVFDDWAKSKKMLLTFEKIKTDFGKINVSKPTTFTIDLDYALETLSALRLFIRDHPIQVEADEVYEDVQEGSLAKPYSGRYSGRTMPKSKTPVLDHFGLNITRLSKAGKLDPVLHRDEEINSLHLSIKRRNKNNIVLIGKAGIGKTSIIHGLAAKMASSLFTDYQFVELNIPSLFAGAKYRGQFEERVRAIANELEGSNEVILFIEDIANLFRVSPRGSDSRVRGRAIMEEFNVFNIIKPYLLNGSVKCICCSNKATYFELEDNHPSLRRIFQKINVTEFTPVETLDALKMIKAKYENFHNVLYSEESLKECVELSVLYVDSGALPEKAIDILDDVGANVRFTNVKPPKHIVKLHKSIENLKEDKNEAVKNQQYEKAADILNDESKLMRQLEYEKTQWTEDLKKHKFSVEKEDVINLMHARTGIPKEILKQRKNEPNLESKLNDNTYMRKKLKEFQLDEKASVRINDIPSELKTSLQQYILYFREFVSQVKGQDIYFDVSITDEGLRLDFEPKGIKDFGQIQKWFDEYFDYIRVKKDQFTVNFEKEVEISESEIIMAELKNQVRFLESQLEILQLKMKNLKLEADAFKDISLAVSDQQKKLISRGFTDINNFRIELKEQVGEGKIKPVLNDLLKHVQEFFPKNNDKFDAVILLNSRFSELELKLRAGVVSRDEEQIEKRKIINALINLINEL